MLTKKKLLCFMLSFFLVVSIFTNGFVSLAALHDYDQSATATRFSYSDSLTIEDVDYTVKLDLTNGDYIGNVYNGTGYYNQVGDKLCVTIGVDATLKGAISLTETRHVDENGSQNTDFTINQYYYLGHVANKLYDNGNSKIAVTLVDGGIWTVADTSLLSSLTIGSGCSIIAPSGYSVVMTVDGTQTPMTTGLTYEGAIVLSLQRVSAATTVGFTITATAETGGKISPATAFVAGGGIVTYTITPEDGYKISDVLVDGISVGAVGSYTFSNVTANHTIKAEFDAETGWTTPFTDVNVSDWYFDSVAFVTKLGLFSGTSASAFSPYENMTRAMLVTILYRLADTPNTVLSAFDDVQSGLWYSEAVSWAAENDIVSGIGGNHIDPNGAVTREAATVMLHNFAVYLGLDVSSTRPLTEFSDAGSVSAWADDAMQWAVGCGLFKGDENRNLNATNNATRAEIAAIIERFIKNVM